MTLKVIPFKTEKKREMIDFRVKLKIKRMKWWLGMENRRAFQSSPLTVKEAVVFEAAPAEECVEGVQRLFPLHRLGVGAVDVGCALRGERIGV